VGIGLGMNGWYLRAWFNGSLINMVYNTYYGMGYNSSTLIWSRLGKKSYPTQVAQLQFEYIWIRQGIMGEIFMLYQSILNLGISHVDKSHKRQNGAIAILLNKCNNNYSWIVYITLRQWARKREAMSYSINSFVNWIVLCKANVE
jgi:hypothetical protein